MKVTVHFPKSYGLNHIDLEMAFIPDTFSFNNLKTNGLEDKLDFRGCRHWKPVHINAVVHFVDATVEEQRARYKTDLAEHVKSQAVINQISLKDAMDNCDIDIMTKPHIEVYVAETSLPDITKLQSN